MGLKMNLRIIKKNQAADPEIGFLTKSILQPYGHAAAMPTAWELNFSLSLQTFTTDISAPFHALVKISLDFRNEFFESNPLMASIWPNFAAQ